MAQMSLNEEITESLLTHLPIISNLTSDILSILQDMQTEEKADMNKVKEVILKMKEVIPHAGELLNIAQKISDKLKEDLELQKIQWQTGVVEFTFIEKNEQNTYFVEKFLQSTNLLHNGIGKIIEYTRSDCEDEHTLREAINFLFDASGLIVEVVDRLTEDDE